jgi:hypothetical protein
MHNRGRRQTSGTTADVEESSSPSRSRRHGHGPLDILLPSPPLAIPVVVLVVVGSSLLVAMALSSSWRRGHRRAGNVDVDVLDLDGSRWRDEGRILDHRIIDIGDDDIYGSSFDDGREEERREGESEVEDERKRRRSPARRIETSIDAVVSYLRDLATLSPDRLWGALVVGMETTNTTIGDGENKYHDDHPFSLKSLEDGICPWRDVEDVEANAPWLPPMPRDSHELSSTHRDNRGKRTRTTNGDTATTTDDVAIWYEHVSKAGGTAFCALAKSNMEVWEVPKYNCMPGKGELMDGRVGTWTIDELRRHLTVDSRHAIVSSEWEPFNSSWLSLSGRDLDDDDGGGGGRGRGGTIPPGANDDNDHRDSGIACPRLLFVTNMRDPCDRLLSSYTFFAITTKVEINTKATRGGGKSATNRRVPPTFHDWLDMNTYQAAQYERGTNKRVGLRAWTMSHNHVTWRFSGGLLSSPTIPRGNVDEWMVPYEVAIRALCQFDLILPMDVMTMDGLGKVALERTLGWTKYEARSGKGFSKSGHVVSAGGIQNSNARSYLSAKDYRQLWEDNWLDNIIYLWCRAVFLARLHCDFINSMEG